MPHPFHLALPVHDIEAARAFYGNIMGLGEGRSSDRWIDWDCFGHQLVTHLVDGYRGHPAGRNKVDRHDVPVPHFGVVLPMQEWQALADHMQGQVDFVIKPHIRFPGETGEQATMFFHDPSGNALEFKGFKDMRRLFER